jgi:uncharacterized protein (DUF427 family)
MKAILDGRLLAESDDSVECGGYRYFPRSAVRMDRLAPAVKTASDRACPHGVQFYDAVLDGVRRERVAWSYEAPQAALRHVDHWIGFWEEVEVA